MTAAPRPKFGPGRLVSPVILALVIAVGAAAWILSGQFGEANAPQSTGVSVTVDAATPPSAVPAGAGSDAGPRERLTQVRVREQSAENRERRIVVRGRTAMSRSVDVRAETAGSIAEIVAERGARLAPGDVLLRFAPDDRPARLEEAKAQVALRQVEYRAARKLNKKGFSPETRLAETRANLEAARAALARIKLDIEHTVIRAPFAGVLEARPAEVGDFVDVGDKLAMVVDLDPAIVIAYVSERDVGKLRVGGPGRAKLVTGEEIDGRIRYLSAMSDESTRTFRIELELPNPEGRVVDGVTAEIVLPVETVQAHRITPAVLTLADDGTVGLKSVNDDGIVEFWPARVVDETADHVWLADLPPTLRIITVGQEFVQAGQKVRVRADGGEAGS